MVGRYHGLNGYEFEQTLGDREGQGSLGCYKSMGSQEVLSDLMSEQQQHNIYVVNKECFLLFQ